MSEIDFCKSPPPAATITFTLEHFAASDRTAAYDSCDHALTPKPSSIARVICFVPQNGKLNLPDFAISCFWVGQVTAPAAKAETAPTATIAVKAPSTRPRFLAVIASSSTPGDGACSTAGDRRAGRRAARAAGGHFRPRG